MPMNIYHPTSQQLDNILPVLTNDEIKRLAHKLGLRVKVTRTDREKHIRDNADKLSIELSIMVQQPKHHKTLSMAALLEQQQK